MRVQVLVHASLPAGTPPDAVHLRDAVLVSLEVPGAIDGSLPDAERIEEALIERFGDFFEEVRDWALAFPVSHALGADTWEAAQIELEATGECVEVWPKRRPDPEAVQRALAAFEPLLRAAAAPFDRAIAELEARDEPSLDDLDVMRHFGMSDAEIARVKDETAARVKEMAGSLESDLEDDPELRASLEAMFGRRSED